MKDKMLVLGFSALGMILGYAIAAGRFSPSSSASADSSVGVYDSIRTRQFEFLDAHGHVAIKMAISGEGTPAIWFFDKNGKARLNLGLYGDGNSFVILNDEREQAAGIFRTIGSKIAPVLVMKAGGQDRMVQGLNWNQSELDPFFVHYDSKGSKTKVFGSY